MKRKVIFSILLCVSILSVMLPCYYYFHKNAIPSENITSVLSMLNDDTSGIAWPKQSTIKLGKLSNPNLMITHGGNYILSGSLANGSITINTDAMVNLTFNGASITNLSGPALKIEKAKNTYITLISDTENSLVDGGTYLDPQNNSAILSTTPITFQGNGSLEIISNGYSGISTDSTINLNNGSLKISATKDGINASEAIRLSGGHLKIDAADTAINCDSTLLVENGVLEIENATNGLVSDSPMTINGGSINIASTITGINIDNTVTINNGNINVMTKQTALLAQKGLTINNGNIHLDTDGSALVAWEGITLNDGILLAFGGSVPTSGIECGSSHFVINGGTLLSTGSNISLPNAHRSKQHTLLLGPGVANIPVHIDDNSKDILTFIPQKGYDQLLFSSPKLDATDKYTISSGGIAEGGTNFYGLYTNALYNGGKETDHFIPHHLLTRLSTSLN